MRIVCDGEIEIADEIEERELLECPECGSELEVKSVDQLELAVAPEQEEDWGE